MWPGDALPQQGSVKWSVFTNKATAASTNAWQAWTKPPGCNWVYAFVISAGGGGSRIGNTSNTGGGGGGSGSVSSYLLPAQVLPDTLYVLVGAGGAGGAASGSNGVGGSATYISMFNRIDAGSYIFLAAGGSGSSGSTGGTGATFPTIGYYGNAAIFNNSIAGVSGSNGAGIGGNLPGSDITPSGRIVTGGAGGGNGSAAGGSIVGVGVMPTVSGGVGSSGGNGQSGFNNGLIVSPGLKYFPMLFSGGSGGGGTNLAGPAGAGGNGAYGCGGGGGGGTTALGGATSGNGGRGGDALVIIGAF